MLTLPTLTTPRLTLRPFTPEDLPHLQPLANDKQIANNIGFAHPYTLQDGEKFLQSITDDLAKNRGFSLAITLTIPATLLGSIGCHLFPEHNRASIGYWLGTPYHNQGYTTEAATAFIHHLFTTHNLHRLTVAHYANNPASGRVMQKIGMHHEATFQDHIKQSETYTDDLHYALLRPQYLAQLHNPRHLTPA